MDITLPHRGLPLTVGSAKLTVCRPDVSGNQRIARRPTY